MTRLCREPGGRSITALLRHHAPTWLTQMPSVLGASELRSLERRMSGVTRGRMLRELAEAVEVMAADVPMILWLEDLHWSDPPTLDWLAYLASRPGTARVLVLATCRPVEVPQHPLGAVRDEMKRHGQCHELPLAGLDATAVDQYLTRRFPASDGLDALGGMIHARTGGNPLFVVNVADDLVRRGVLVQRSGRWAFDEGSALARIAIPADVRQMIARQLDRLHPDERTILDTASVAGLEFSTAAVSAAAQLDQDQVERCCAALAERGAFLTAHGEETWPDTTVAGRYGFRHALYQEIVYESTPAARRADLHRRIGERREAGLRERAGEAATELAMHFERGRDPLRAIHYLRVAGEVATRRHAAGEAVAHLTRALQLLEALPDTLERAEEEVALRVALGGPLMAIKGRGAPEVEQTYTRAQELCQRIGDTPRLFPAIWGLFLFRRSRGEIDRAHAFATRLPALAQAAGEPGLVIQAHHALWATSFARGELSAVSHHVGEALALYDSDRHAALAAVYGNHDPAVCALGHHAWALELSGESEQASRQSAEAVTLAKRLGHPFSEAHALLYAARLHQFRGDWRTTRDRAQAAGVLAREWGFVQLEAWAAVTGGWAMAEAGDVSEGVRQAQDGIAAIRALGSEDFQTYFLGLLAVTLARAGEPAAALEVVTEALGAVERSGERFYAAELYRQRGELLRVTGHRVPDEVARCFENALVIARQQRARALEHRVLRDADGRGQEPFTG